MNLEAHLDVTNMCVLVEDGMKLDMTTLEHVDEFVPDPYPYYY